MRQNGLVRRRTLFPLILLLALAALGVILLVRGREREVPAVETSMPEDETHAQTPVPTLETARAEDVSGRAPVPATTEKPAEGIRVRVLDRESGLPVRAATLRFASNSAVVTHDPHRPMWFPSIEESLEGVNTTSITDERGEATLPALELPALADARLGNRWGGARIDERSPRPVLIEIALDRAIEIQVVDGAGHSVDGAKVAIINCPGNGPRSEAWRGRTGADGLARVRHFDTCFKLVPGRHACAALDILANDLESVEIDPNALPKDPIRLTMPPTGSVEVETVEEGSTPILVEHLQLGNAAHLDSKGQPAWTGGQRWPDRIEPGRAEFAYVGLGLEIYATAPFPGFPPSSARAHGPRVPGEHVKMRYDLGHGYPVLVLHLVDEHRAALSNQDVQVLFHVGYARGSYDSNSEERTDERGVIHVRMLTDATKEIRGTLVLRVTSSGPNSKASARVEVPSELVDGDNDVGVAVLTPPELLVAGTVVDDRGEPVSRAYVSAESRAVSASDRWEACRDLNDVCDEHGAFELRGVKPGPVLRVRANDRQHAQGEPVDAPAGAHDLRVVLPRGASLEGSVLLDTSLRCDDLSVRIARAGASGPSSTNFDQHDRGSVRPDATFSLSSLRAGDVDVEIRSRVEHEREPLVVIEHVILQAGETSRDPRLEHVDVRHVHPLHVDIVDEKGAPVVAGFVWCAGDSRAARSIYFKDGGATLLARAPSVDLDVRSSGYRSARVHGVTGDTRVVLRRGIPVRLRLPDTAHLPDPPRQLGLKLQLVQASDAPPISGVSSETLFTFFEVGTETLVKLPAAGTYELRWIACADSNARTKARELASLSAIRADFAESDVERSFTVEPDAAALTDALRALDR
jgi:hypothetical protein